MDLIEVYMYPYEQFRLREFLRIGGDEDCYAHVLYKLSTGERIYYQGSTECFLGRICNNEFMEHWMGALFQGESFQRMIKITYSLPPSKAQKKLLLTTSIENILQPTDGFLIFQDQFIDIAQRHFSVKKEYLLKYISNWNLKKPLTRDLIGSIYLGQHSIEEIMEDRAYDSINYFLYK